MLRLKTTKNLENPQMHALKMTVTVANHRFQAELPPDVPDGITEILVFTRPPVKTSDVAAKQAHLQRLLGRLQERPQSRSIEEINAQIAEERASWGD